MKINQNNTNNGISSLSIPSGPSCRTRGRNVAAKLNLAAVFLGFMLSPATALLAESVSAQPTCIDLSPYYTAKLTDSLNSPASVRENNLAILPKGRQIFCGVPFQVGGILQLSGKKIQEWGRKEYPEAINGIKIGHRCQRLHLLHGAGGVYDGYGVAIGKLVLHYADNSLREIEIRNGIHVRDWWGDPKQAVSAKTSMLAWSGTNPALKKYGGPQPGSLWLYQTTFENPQPDREITSIDYVSAMENSSPFMVGLSID